MTIERKTLLPFLIIAAATFLAHGWAVGDGMFLDDHYHKLHWVSDDWSFSGALDATTINPERFLDIWWQEVPLQWQYSRPFAAMVSKVIYRTTNGSVATMHFVGVCLHLATAVMIYVLCFRMTRQRFWSVIGALLFVVYSHTIVAVAWLAAQNVLWQTTFCLAAILLYAKASGLQLYAGQPDKLAMTHVPKIRLDALILVLLLWGLALFSRESAIILPTIFIAFDLAFGGKRYIRSRLVVYAVFAVLAGLFVFWRFFIFYHRMPDFYVHRYDGPGYIGWWIAKFLHYMTCVLFQSPMTVGPTARYQPWVEGLSDCLLMLAIVTIIATLYITAARRARGWWIWPLWIVLSILPMIPVAATPHSGYMPGVGFAIGLAVAAGLNKQLRPKYLGKAAPAVAICFLVAMTCYLPIYRMLWKSCVGAERWTILCAEPHDPPAADTHTFYINLPFVSVYVPMHLRSVWGLDQPGGDRSHVLTFSSDGLGAGPGGEVRQLDDHAFIISNPEQPWFAGLMGRLQIESMREGRFTQGQRISAELFDVEIVQADERGVSQIKFTFPEPLSSPNYQFYFASEKNGASRLIFEEDAMSTVSHSSLKTQYWRAVRDRYDQILSIVRQVIQSDLYMTGEPFPGPRR